MKIANSVDQTGAFPTGSPEHGSQNGLTKREYFAAKAMQGLLASSSPIIISELVEMVDALIKELDKND